MPDYSVKILKRKEKEYKKKMLNGHGDQSSGKHLKKIIKSLKKTFNNFFVKYYFGIILTLDRKQKTKHLIKNLIFGIFKKFYLFTIILKQSKITKKPQKPHYSSAITLDFFL